MQLKKFSVLLTWILFFLTACGNNSSNEINSMEILNRTIKNFDSYTGYRIIKDVRGYGFQDYSEEKGVEFGAIEFSNDSRIAILDNKKYEVELTDDEDFREISVQTPDKTYYFDANLLDEHTLYLFNFFDSDHGYIFEGKNTFNPLKRIIEYYLIEMEGCFDMNLDILNDRYIIKLYCKDLSKYQEKSELNNVDHDPLDPYDTGIKFSKKEIKQEEIRFVIDKNFQIIEWTSISSIDYGDGYLSNFKETNKVSEINNITWNIVNIDALVGKLDNGTLKIGETIELLD
ncbi:MAG: hypothetical protein HFF01_00410 [Erysipelotrichaceae bacterium]|nr:hypothetical protein [Erysipelotrichaceae bacterium]